MGFFGYFEKYYLEQAFGWQYIVSMCVLVIQISLVMNSFKWDKKGMLIKLLDCCLCFLLYLFVFCFVEYFLGSHQYINYICWPFIVFSHAFYLCHYKFFDKLSKGVALTITLYLEPMIASSLLELFGLNFSPYFGPISVIITALLALLSVLFMKKYTLKEEEKSNYLSLFLMLFLIAFIVSFIIVDLPEGESFLNAFSHLLIYSLILIFTFVSYYYFYSLNLDFTKSLENQALLLNEEKARKSLEASSENLENLRKRRHDMKNQYQYMRLLLEKGDKEKLNAFFARMIDGSSFSLSEIDEEDGSLFLRQIKAENPGIRFLFHSNFSESDPLFLESETLIKRLIGENAVQGAKNEIWLEEGEGSLLLTFASKKEAVPSFEEGALLISSRLQEGKDGSFLTYKISKRQK